MSNGPAVPSRSPLGVALALAVGFAATFLLPYLVPVAQTVSDSYVVGFSNRACVGIFLVFLAAFSWWVKDSGILAQPLPLSPERPSRALLGIMLAVLLALLVGEWRVLLHHPVLQEAIYFLDRLHHLAAGELPYRDFEFAYGPLLLYLPLALARVTGLSLVAAYFSTWILEYLAGAAFIYFCLLPFPGTRKQKNVIFLLLSSSWLAGALSLGPNYTPFRFFIAPLLAISVAPRLTSSLSSVRVVGEVLLAEAMLLLVSPEQATAFLGAALLFLAVSAVRTRSSLLFARLGAVLAGSALLLLPLLRLGLFETAAAMSRGGFNFPLLPTPMQLPLFLLVLVSAASLTSAIAGRHALGAVEMLVLLGLFLLPAAFGRADPGHFLINTIPLTLSGLLLLTAHPRAFRAISLTYLVCVLLLPAPLLIEANRRSQGAVLRSTPVPAQPAGSTVPFAPFSYPPATPSGPSFRAQTGFYDGIQNVTTPEQVARVIDELGTRHPTQLLVPDHPYCLVLYNSHYLRRALYTPFVPPGRSTSYTLKPLCDYIGAHYAADTALPAPPGYQIWTAKP